MLGYLERIAVPRLARHGHHVRVPGEHDAAGGLWPQRGEQVGLGAPGVRRAPGGHAVARQVVLDEADER